MKNCEHEWVSVPGQSWRYVTRYLCSTCGWWGYRRWPELQRYTGRAPLPPIRAYAEGKLPRPGLVAQILAEKEHLAEIEHARWERKRYMEENP